MRAQMKGTKMLIPFSIADFRIISLICEPWMWVPALSGMKEVMHEIGSHKVYPRFKMLCLILFPVKDIRKYAFLTHHNIVVKKWFSDFVTPMTQVGVSVYVSVSKLKRQSLTDLITQWQGHLLSCPVQLKILHGKFHVCNVTIFVEVQCCITFHSFALTGFHVI